MIEKLLGIFLLLCIITLESAFAETQIIEKNIQIHSLYSPHKINFFGIFPKKTQKLIIKIKGPELKFRIIKNDQKKEFIAHGLYAGYNPTELSDNEEKIVVFLKEKNLFIDNIAFSKNKQNLFWGEFYLPKNSPIGHYEIQYYFYNNRGNIHKEIDYFIVKRDKLQNIFYNLAYDTPLLNSLVVIILAIIATQVINFISRKLRS